MSLRHARPSELANGRQSRRLSLRNTSTSSQQSTRKRHDGPRRQIPQRRPSHTPDFDDDDDGAQASPSRKRQRRGHDDGDDDGNSDGDKCVLRDLSLCSQAKLM